MHNSCLVMLNWHTGHSELACNSLIQVGYHIGVHAPGHRHPTDYWRVGHHVLLAHAAAVQRFRQALPDGKIGIVANSDFFEPLTNSAADKVVSLLWNFKCSAYISLMLMDQVALNSISFGNSHFCIDCLNLVAICTKLSAE